MKRTAAALLALALPCSAADRIVELFARDGVRATYEVPEGKLVTVIGRSYRESTSSSGPGANLQVVMIRNGIRFTNQWESFESIGNTVAGPAEFTFRMSIELPRLTNSPAFCLLREWEPTPAPADTIPVVPAGASAVLTVETSSDLATWQHALRTNLPAVTTNRFFRVGLERAD